MTRLAERFLIPSQGILTTLKRNSFVLLPPRYLINKTDASESNFLSRKEIGNKLTDSR